MEVVSAGELELDPDANASPLPVPFYVDLEREGFTIPALVQFYFVRRVGPVREISVQLSEIHAAQFFSAEGIEELRTFEQVRQLCRYALSRHPDVNR